ncbi:MAG: hypothetical protein LC105_13485 [Chitinophagales bacterium]|nr:hypothetical protein [Chitinophagales bacterium]MCZ2394870.1 hypothetical protein [Chitinophagales bacterium]
MRVELEHVFTGHSEPVYSLCLGDKKDIFYSGSGDQFVGSWDIQTKAFNGPLVKANGSIYSLYHDAKNQILYVGQRFGVVILVDLTKKNEPKAIQAHEGDVFAIQEANGKIFTVGGDGFLKVWEKDMQFLHDLKLCNTNIRCIHYSPMLNELQLGLSDHSIQIIDLYSLNPVQSLRLHNNSVFTIESIHDNCIISAGRDAVFHIWKKINKQWVHQEMIQAHLYTVNHISKSPDERYLASAGRDKTIKIWDTKSMKLLKVLNKDKYSESHSHSVNRLLWMSETELISTGDDRKIIYWKIKEE